MVRDKSKSARFLDGVKSLFKRQTSRQDEKTDQETDYAKNEAAVTFSTEFPANVLVKTLLHSESLLFMTCNSHEGQKNSSLFLQENKAFVHYEPKKQQITLGATSNKSSTSPTMKLTLEQYTWLIRQLKEEQEIEDNFGPTVAVTPMIGIISPMPSSIIGAVPFDLFKRLFIRFIQVGSIAAAAAATVAIKQGIFVIPKSLLLQAADYIPIIQDIAVEDQTLFLPEIPASLQLVSDDKAERLKRYCHLVTLCCHELLIVTHQANSNEPSPPSSFIIYNSKGVVSNAVQCTECSISTGLDSVANRKPQRDSSLRINSSITARLYSSHIHIKTPRLSLQEHQSIMFPISYQQYTILNDVKKLLSISSAIDEEQSHRSSFEKQEPRNTQSAFQYIPPDRTMPNSTISSISEYDPTTQEEEEEERRAATLPDDTIINSTLENMKIQEPITNSNPIPQKYGYVALDNENEEILVVFPGTTMSHDIFRQASFVPVPWQEIIAERKKPTTKSTTIAAAVMDQALETTTPWVLDCALAAWRRCEMRVVTLLMRLCGTMPPHYKVVILGHSLGGAVAALCASSLRSTKLLLDRPITVCAIHSPRVGNKPFLDTLTEQDIKTIRITDYKDNMAHLPPRTSGLLHVGGDATVILPTENEYHQGYLIENMEASKVEDVLHRTFSASKKEYYNNTSSHDMAWDIDFDKNICIS